MPGMSSDAVPMLASDADRDRVIEQLKQRTADGTLTLDEFANRVDRALVARSRGDLQGLVLDLPRVVAEDAKRRSPTHTVLSIMSGAGTRGRWRCGSRVVAVAVMGGCHVDFRGAEIDVAEVHVTAVAVMGGIDIVVPEGIDVTMDGLPVMGGRSMQVKNVPTLPGSPRIVVHAFPVMGGVTVRSRPRKQRRPAAEIPADSGDTAAATPYDGTVTIMFSDICDYSGMTDRLGDLEAHELLREYTAMIREQLAAHGGREVKSHGDGLMLAFPSVVRALRCAVDLQHAMAKRNVDTSTEPMRVHIGIHAGEVVREGEDYLGSTVIIASRLADAAGPDEILVSSVARELAAGSREFAFDPPRGVALKGLTETRQAYPVKWTS
jgi:class 3 adenylate cyclase